MKGRRWHAARFLLRALGEAAHKTGDRRVAFGCRALAVATGIEYSTASIILRQLTEAGWVDLLEPGRGEHADLFELTIPKDLVDVAPDLRWERGKVHALRPAFRELGPVAAFVFEAIEAGRATTTTTLPQHTGVSLRAAHEAVELLTAVGLVSRTEGQLVAHPHLLPVLAEDLGVNEAIVTQLRRYAQQRAEWRAYLTRHEAQTEVGDDVEAYWWPPDDGSGWQLVAA